jgi:hypothetical protein
MCGIRDEDARIDIARHGRCAANVGADTAAAADTLPHCDAAESRRCTQVVCQCESPDNGGSVMCESARGDCARVLRRPRQCS